MKRIFRRFQPFTNKSNRNNISFQKLWSIYDKMIFFMI
ncbi:hypothetical protein LEP1GSC108_4842 [Leptospira weilii str. UI 13098]|nr:hypothetical protein LEP1GSC086_4494 [Leptospira weilii str. LNT 1234]EMN90108.1 hypothetical protein LEP1GSC108_4842 [Leptospira weilii str. UI 13098]